MYIKKEEIRQRDRERHRKRQRERESRGGRHRKRFAKRERHRAIKQPLRFLTNHPTILCTVYIKK